MTLFLWLVALGGLGGRLLAVLKLRALFSGRWRLDPLPPGEAAPLRVSVCIPARDEARVIGRLLASLDAQDHADLEVILVDDHSTDETAAIAARHRCRVLRGAPLPEGWLGKNWALHQAVREATGEILLFVDADTWHHPAAVRTVADALRERDVLVVLGHQQVDSLAERLVPPFFWSLILSLFDPARAEDPARPDDALGNGQFAAFRREAYLAAGGHEAVKDRIVEDVALARAVKRVAPRFALRLGPELTHTRMYEGWSSVWRGFSKNAAVVDPERKGLSAALTLVSLLLVFQAELWPWLALGLSPGLAAAGAAQLVLIFYGRFLVMKHVCKAERDPRPYLLQPLGAAVGMAIMLNSLRQGLTGRVSWKGRRIRSRSL